MDRHVRTRFVQVDDSSMFSRLPKANAAALVFGKRLN
jgi:hypothetical protein